VYYAFVKLGQIASGKRLRTASFVSREIFSDIMAFEERHIDCLENRLKLIEKISRQNYLQSKM